MTEETKPTEEKEQPKPSNPIESAREAANRLKEENNRMEQNLNRLEELKADNLLSGTANTGPSAPPKTEDQIKKEEAMKFWEGTGIDKAIEKHG